MIIDSRRVAQFAIPDEWVRDIPMHVMVLLSQVVVIRCEYRYERLAFWYTAMGPEFPESPPVCGPPEVGVSMVMSRRPDGLDVVRLEFCDSAMNFKRTIEGEA